MSLQQKKPPIQNKSEDKLLVKLSGIVHRVTFHNSQNGWSVLRVTPFNQPNQQVTVTLHQTKVFAGASLDFFGHWTHHPQYGDQFTCEKVIEKKPATTHALEKYLGSGLIHGVGPVTAKRIVKHFGSETLDVFENQINKLTEVPGIAALKLKSIASAWQEHSQIRQVMMFLQEHEISTLFAVKIYKTYGEKSLDVVKSNPYQLAKDIYGIGFFSADSLALKLGFNLTGIPRLKAAINHILAQSRDEGHCFLTQKQIIEGINELLGAELISEEKILSVMEEMQSENDLKSRVSKILHQKVFYNKTLFFDEYTVAKKIIEISQQKFLVDQDRLNNWLQRYFEHSKIELAEEQLKAVQNSVSEPFSILTGGPGCGKTTTLKVLIKLLIAMGKKVILAAPTGRAAQRMMEVVGVEAKTIHRLLGFLPGGIGFKKNESEPLDCEFLVVDECSMLDISLTASLLKAVPSRCQVLFIGDADQLPSVGAGNVLRDLIKVNEENSHSIIPVFKLSKIFRQAQSSLIIKFAHEINKGEIPQIESPIEKPNLWQEKVDCLFIDSEEATEEQLKFIRKTKNFFKQLKEKGENKEDVVIREKNKGRLQVESVHINESEFVTTSKFIKDPDKILDENQTNSTQIDFEEIKNSTFTIPKKFQHLDLSQFFNSTLIHQSEITSKNQQMEELKIVLKKIPRHSTLHYGMSAMDSITKLYCETIPKYFGKNAEIQILAPMVRGSLGTHNLNKTIQNITNPFSDSSGQIKLGERYFRVNDRVIQKRNNYNLGVFNGDIGRITSVDALEMIITIEFGTNDAKLVTYTKEDIIDLDHAYAITIHKSQGSEFEVVIIPILGQHFKMLFRNLIYTGLTRAKKLIIFVGSRKALNLGIRNQDARTRQTMLTEIILHKS
jgi:exodeoxyribonuclease V alpha subunit